MIDRKAKLTKRVVDALPVGTERAIVWDTELKGFGLRVETSGTKTFLVRYRSAGRKRFLTIGRYGTLTPDQARANARALLNDVAKGANPADARASERTAATVEILVDRFLTDHVDAKRKPITALNYRGLLANHLLSKFRSRKAADITRADLARLQLSLRDRPYQANRLIAVVSAMYSWGGKHGLTPENYNPARGIERFAESRRERYLGTAEVGRFGDAVRDLEIEGRLAASAATALRLLLLTGARLREILHLRWEHVDFERGVLRLPDSKTGAKAIILNAPALALLNSIVRTGEFVIAGDRPDTPRSDLKKPWKAVQARAELDGVRLHDLRHTYASYGAAASLGLPIIGKLLGHTQAATTQRYLHLDDDPLRKASDRIGAALNAAMDRTPADNLESLAARK